MAKRRDSNFSKEDTKRLIELVGQYVDIILNNKCTAETNRQKEDAWNLITEEYNSCSTIHRTAKQLKHKVDNMKKARQLQQWLGASRDGEGEEGEGWLKKESPNSKRGEGDKYNTTYDMEWSQGSGGVDDWPDDETGPDTDEPAVKRRSIYVKPLPKLIHSDVTKDSDGSKVVEMSNSGDSKPFTDSQISDLFKLECKQKKERHRQLMKYEKRMQEAQLHKLALEARIYEAQLNKTNLEVQQLTRRLQREEDLYQKKVHREAELHILQMERARAGLSLDSDHKSHTDSILAVTIPSNVKEL